MINVEFSLFVSFILSAWLIFIAFFYLKESTRAINIDKKYLVIKKICEICSEINFLYQEKVKYWRCSFCGSLNKEDDNRDRDSSR